MVLESKCKHNPTAQDIDREQFENIMIKRVQEYFEAGHTSILVNDAFLVMKIQGGYIWMKDGIPTTVKSVFDDGFMKGTYTYKVMS